MDEALKRAIAIQGGPSNFAAALCITHGAVRKWTRCPSHHVIFVERITGVTREELRPDLYPPRQKYRGPVRVVQVKFQDGKK